MKKILKALICSILFVVMIMSSAACAGSEEYEIKKAYAKLHNVKASEVVYKSYGEFDGTYVLIISCKESNVSDANRTETVDGVDFHFNVYITFDVYREKAFYTLQQAFARGWLTHDNLLTVRDNHRADYEWVYQIYEENEEDESANRLDEAIEKEIIAAFVAAHADDKYPVTEDEISLRCCAVFDDVYVLFVDVAGWDYDCAIWHIFVADVEFVYGSGQRMTVYSNGAFYSLSNAYENEILSYDDLITLQKKYQSDHDYLY